MGPRSWLIVYIIAILLFSFIMLWFATSTKAPQFIPTESGPNKITVVEGFTSKEHEHKFLLHPLGNTAV